MERPKETFPEEILPESVSEFANRLFFYIKNGDRKGVKDLIALLEGIENSQKKGDKVSQEKKSLRSLVFSYQKEEGKEDEDRNTPLNSALQLKYYCRHKHYEEISSIILNAIIKSDDLSPLTVKNKNGMNFFSVAIQRAIGENYKIIKELFQNENLSTEQYKIVKELINSSCEVTEKTPLNLAAYRNDLLNIALLLEEITGKQFFDKFALQQYSIEIPQKVERKRKEEKKYSTLEQMAIINYRDKYGDTALHYATRKLVEEMKKYHPSSITIGEIQKNIAMLIFYGGASFLIPNYYGETPLSYVLYSHVLHWENIKKWMEGLQKLYIINNFGDLSLRYLIYLKFQCQDFKKKVIEREIVKTKSKEEKDNTDVKEKLEKNLRFAEVIGYASPLFWKSVDWNCMIKKDQANLFKLIDPLKKIIDELESLRQLSRVTRSTKKVPTFLTEAQKQIFQILLKELERLKTYLDKNKFYTELTVQLKKLIEGFSKINGQSQMAKTRDESSEITIEEAMKILEEMLRIVSQVLRSINQRGEALNYECGIVDVANDQCYYMSMK